MTSGYWERFALGRRRWTRRRALMMSAKAGLGASGLILIGCGDDTGDESAPAPSPGASAAATTSSPTSEPEQARGGVVHLRAAADPETLDVQRGTTNKVLDPLSPVFSNLVYVDPLGDGEIVGDLAEDWEVSDDGLVWTFHLRQGVTWHDGTPFTSDDVLFTFNRALDPPEDVVTPRWKGFSQYIADVSAPDESTIVFTLNLPDVSFLSALAGGWTLIVPRHNYTDDGKELKADPIGTGPFVFKKYDRGVQVELVRNDNYFKSDLPYLDGLKFFIIPDGNSSIQALRAGKIHGLISSPYVTYNDAQQLQSELGEEVRIQSAPRGSGFRILWNVSRPPWDDPRVRRAAYLTIDRDEALTVLTQDQGWLGAPIFPESGWGYKSDELKGEPGYRSQKDEDIIEAKALLEQAGHPDGFQSSLLTRNLPENVRLAEWAAGQFAKAGIKLDPIDVKESAAGLAEQRKGDFDTVSDGGAPAISDPAGQLTFKFITGGGRNFGGYSNAKLDKLYGEIQIERDREKRNELVRAAERILMWDDPAEASAYWAYNMYVTRSEMSWTNVPMVHGDRHEYTALSS